MIAHHSTIFEGITEIFGSLAAISTGTAALVSAVFSTRIAKKRGLAECDQRIRELGQAFRDGIKLADQRPKQRKKMVE